jgi:ABC-type multidrug transport system fused ATPase/permease subunit
MDSQFLPENPTRMPQGLYRYIWQTSGRDQIWLSILSTAVFLLTLVPLELQRRVVNAAVYHGELQTVALLCLGYAAVELLQGGIKLTLNIYRGSVGEAAIRRLRRATYQASLILGADPAHDGVNVSIVVSEVGPVGGFVAVSVSEPLLHGGVMASVFGYMLYLEPWMALTFLGVFVPQFVFVPLLLGRINRRTKSIIETLREVSVGIVRTDADRESQAAFEAHTDRVYVLRIAIFRFKFTMHFLMNILHHMGVVVILFVGGWFIIDGRTEVGTVVAFVSGLNRVNDPWGDLVNYFREMTSARVRYRLIAAVLGEASPGALHRRAG